ncbi:hypothetical protein AE921_16900 [Xanthomonas arboricola]|uniref:AbiV family abortive infection protein n=1 Tax=Xanthomonas arboricola TaxID=56448 RepID=UPI00069DF2D1|nr:AbiV family abortive infection protein [Xanthomonas arboricola]KOA97638.1 hypothetical protein AE921_16900 [Xanthomonas arboricola]KOB11161.1 hypothetical protein AE922_02150 [Xanthomonas arboricola]KOB11899.1 hypothetical protein AE923_03025 [Xanthomonas arboricola]KOB14966.1 hypothetical protein AE925_18545 [Xanthomonas arboricola]KOB25532.1 hypothetical protein AE926_03475 [Xanthomonas arboricola]
MSQKLQAYKGRLSPSQLADGMNAAVENAARLANDAELLVKSGSYSTAVSVAALAIEEAGKVSILRSLALAKTDDDVRNCWRDYRSHTQKNAAWILPDLVAKGARKLEELRPIFAEGSEHPGLLDNVKQLGFYTDCLGTAHWSRPADVIDEKLAESILFIAKLFARPTAHTAREVELWIEHMGPVWKQDMAWMQQALLNWQEAMHKEGLSSTQATAMHNFIHGTVGAEV